MPLFPSDFKKFQHVSTDDKTTVLKHPKGHSITIAHSALSPELLKQLKAMGGAIEADKSNSVNNTNDGKVAETECMAEGGIMASIRRSPLAGEGANATQAARDAADKVSKDVNSSNTDVRTPEQKAKAAEQAKAHGYAEGGEVEPSMVDEATKRAREIYNNLINPAPSAFASAKGGIPDEVTSSQFAPKSEPQQLDPNTWAQARKMQVEENTQNAAQTAAAQQDVIAQNQARVDAGMQPLPVPNVPQGPQMPQQNTGIAQGMPQPGAQSTETPGASQTDPMAMMQSGMDQRLAGINQQATAQGQMGEQQNAALQKAQLAQQEAQSQYQQHYDQLNSEREMLVKDIQDGHIDPQKYWNDHSKVAAGIGMILAGFNPTNSPNAAINFLKHQMEQNLESQKANLSSKQSLLSANIQQFGNIRDAMNMTRVMQNDIMQNELQQAAAKATSPLAKAAALQAAGQLKMEAAPMFQKFVAGRTMNQLTQAAQTDPNKIPGLIQAMQSVDPERAKDMMNRHVPGMGLANTMEGAKGVIEMKAANDSVKSAVQRLREITKKTGKSLDPNTRAEADTIRNSLIGALRVPITGPGAMNEGEREMLTNMIPDATAIFSLDSNTTKRLDTLEKIMSNKYENMAKANGLNIPNPTSLSKDIKTVNGKRYKRGPNGEAVPLD